jgi:hypothetical protein
MGGDEALDLAERASVFYFSKRAGAGDGDGFAVD